MGLDVVLLTHGTSGNFYGSRVVFVTPTITGMIKSPSPVQAIAFFPHLFMLISQPVKVAVVSSSGAGHHSPIKIAEGLSSNNSSR